MEGAGNAAPSFLKVAIVGGAPSSDHLAPFADTSWKIWGMGFRRKSLKRCDLLFEIHDNRPYAQDGYERGLADSGIPLIVGRAFPIAAPQVSVFPFDAASALMGSQYLTSSAAYMMAYAILQGASEIGVYGCDMAVDDAEYFYQRPCMEAWIGYARGRGIAVHVPEVSPLGKSSFVYGADGLTTVGVFSAAGFTSLADEHRDAMAEIDRKTAELRDRWHAHNGAAQSYERMARVSRAVAAGNPIAHLKDTILVKP